MAGKVHKQHMILSSLSSEIARIRGKGDMLHLVRTTLKQYINFDDSFILRYNKATRSCRPYIYHVGKGRSDSPAFESQLAKEYPFGDDTTLDNAVVEVQDVELLLSNGNKEVAFIHHNGIKEFVTLKLIEGNELTGLFVLLSEKKNVFTPDCIDLLKQIAYPISIATANIIANEEIANREEEKNSLLSLSTEIAALKTRQDLFSVVNGKIKKLFSISEFGFSKINEGGKTFSALMMDIGTEIKKHADYDQIIATKFSVEDPLFTEVINAEHPVLYDVDALAKMEGMPAYVYFWKNSGIQRVLIAALRAGGTAIGTAIFILEKDSTIDTKDFLLKGVCSQLAVAVSNILANEKVQKREEEKSLLLSLSNEIAALKNREDLSWVVNTKIKAMFSLKEFGIAQIDESVGTYSAFMLEFTDATKQLAGFKSVTSAVYSIHDPICSAIMRSEELLLIDVNEVANQPGMPAYVDFWKKAGFKYYLAMLLRVGGKIIGYVIFHIEDKDTFDVENSLLKGVCAQLAVAVSNILANEKIIAKEAEKTRLLEFSNAMASVRDKQMLAKMLKSQLNELFGIEDYVIHVLSKDKKTHRPVLFDPETDFAQHPDFQKLIDTDTDVNDGVFNKILATEDLVTFNVEEWFDSSTAPTYSNAAKAIDLKQMAGISLRLGEENIAVMNFRKDGISPFTFQRPLFKSICSQLAIAISNITAIDEIKGREEEKSLLLEFSNAIASVRDKYSFSKVLKQQLARLFSIEDYVINILSEDQQSVVQFLYDSENELFKTPEFMRILKTPINVNDGIFDRILASEGPVTFKVAEWAALETKPVYLDAAVATGLKNMTGIRIQLGDRNIAFLSFKHDDEGLPQSRLIFLKSICSQIAIAVANIVANEKIKEQLIEIEQYREQLEEEKIYLKEEIETAHNYSEIIGESPEIKKVFRMVTQVASADSTVLLLGETGTGKELIARAIHNASPRKNKLMIKINCAALPANLIESELFGHERGSFTGAFERRIGKFELANNGTLFLDEIGEMPLELQVKLLRALQEKEIERIGGRTTIKTDVRIIAATNRDLEKLMEEGKFREDLYYRLNIFPIRLPALRQRREDIPQLAAHFLRRFCKKAGKKLSTLSDKALEQLQQYHFPGNIRELEHLIERNVLLTTGDTINTFDLPNTKSRSVNEGHPENFKVQTIFENEKDYILKILKYVEGRIAGAGGAAEILGIPPSTLNSRIKKLGIRKEHHG
jgi:transcriptional regulator with GAF, ATPase, and Fis domain